MIKIYFSLLLALFISSVFGLETGLLYTTVVAIGMADVYTSAGEAFVVDQIDAFGTFYIGWGTGAGTHVKGSTTLFTEASEARVSTTDTQPLADIMQWVATITADAAKTITNAGVFDALTAGNLIVASDFTGVALALGDKIEFTFTLEQT